MKDMTLEQALGELEQVVEQLDAGDLDLDQVLTLYERGQWLARHCQKQLDEAELRIEQLAGNG